MTERTRLSTVVALAAALALTLAGCASDSGDAETDASEPAPAAEPSTPAEPASEAAEAPAEGDALLANVPEVEGGTQEGQEDIQEGGIHIFGTVDGAPADVVAAYETALETNGWTIEGSGGDPSGELGAGVQANRDDGRYLSLNVGGPGEGTAFGDLCIWPTKPDDTNCGNDDQQQQDQDQDQDQDQQEDDGGPPAGVEGFIPDDVEQFIP